MSESAEILLVEDSPEDVFLFRRALALIGADVRCGVVNTATAASLYLKQEGDYSGATAPKLIVSDSVYDAELGTDLLQWVRAHPRFKDIPFVLFTGDGNPRLANDAMALGANNVVIKPTDFQEYATKVRDMMSFIKSVPEP